MKEYKMKLLKKRISSDFLNLKYENTFYQMSIYYLGNYLEDIRRGIFETSSLSVVIKPKSGNIEMSYAKGELFLSNNLFGYMSINEIDYLKELLEIAKKSGQYMLEEITKVEKGLLK